MEVVDITDALLRCNSEVTAVLSMLRCAFVALRRLTKRDATADESLAALVASAVTAARDSKRFGSPRMVGALTQWVFGPACAIALAYPLPELTVAVVALADGLLRLTEVKRPHVSRAVATAFAAA